MWTGAAAGAWESACWLGGAVALAAALTASVARGDEIDSGVRRADWVAAGSSAGAIQRTAYTAPAGPVDASDTLEWGRPSRTNSTPASRATGNEPRRFSNAAARPLAGFDWGDLSLEPDSDELDLDKEWTAIRRTDGETPATGEPAERVTQRPSPATPNIPSFEEAFAQGPQALEVDCDVERQKLKPINAITCNIAAEPGAFPPECDLGNPAYKPREFPPMCYTWVASSLCHKPLYFEQPEFERYGHALPPVIQPIVSAGHFFGTVLILPYKMGIELPNECVYSLGYYRPGSCAPFHIRGFPISARGALFEAGAIVGGILLLPP